MNNLHTAYLYIGRHEQTYDAVILFLKKIFCKKNNCMNCVDCNLIVTKQHPSIVWFYPDNKYVLDDFDILLKKISFMLEDNSQFFFIIDQAEALSVACSNALLKIIEEPPYGYHFIFIANHTQSILPTIQSRCIIQNIYNKNSFVAENKYAKFFIEKYDPQDFLLSLSKDTVLESDVFDLIDYLIDYYTQKLIQKRASGSLNDYDFFMNLLNFLQNAVQHKIMPGSGKIFLKEFFLYKDMLERQYEIS